MKKSFPTWTGLIILLSVLVVLSSFTPSECMKKQGNGRNVKWNDRRNPVNRKWNNRRKSPKNGNGKTRWRKRDKRSRKFAEEQELRKHLEDLNQEY